MTVILPIAIAMILVPIWDWAAMSRLALFAWDCDYQYWPLSKSRVASLLLLISAACLLGVVATGKSNIPRMWGFIVVATALLVWGAVAFLDVLAQNRRGYRAPVPPARYSDPRF